MNSNDISSQNVSEAAAWINQHMQQIDSASVPDLAPDQTASREDVMAFAQQAGDAPQSVQQVTASMDAWGEFLQASRPLQGASDELPYFRAAPPNSTPTPAAAAGPGLGGEAAPEPAVPPTATATAPSPTTAPATTPAEPPPTSGDQKLAMLAYSPWHANRNMETVRAGITPDIRDAGGNLIPYDTMDQRVLDWDLNNFRQAGITTLAMDWSNNQPWPEGTPEAAAAQGNGIAQMEVATEKIAQFYASEQAQGRPTPKLAIMIGSPGATSADALQQKAEQVKGLMAKYPGVFETRTDTDGQTKPLVLKYDANGPDQPYVAWNDESLDVVEMTGWADQRGLSNTASWEARNNNPLTVGNDTWVALSAAHRGNSGWEDPNDLQTREGGDFLKRAAAQTLANRPDVVFIQSYYEGVRGEELDAERTNDIAPSVENGSKDWDTVTQFIADFKKS